MSSLWTPGGERRVPAPQSEPTAPPPAPAASRPAAPAGSAGSDQPTDEELAALRKQLSDTPAALVVANHIFGLFELAALHLSLKPPQFEEARVAIDAAAAIVDGLAGRLGDAEATAQEGLAQLRLAFVQIKSASESPSPG